MKRNMKYVHLYLIRGLSITFILCWDFTAWSELIFCSLGCNWALQETNTILDLKKCATIENPVIYLVHRAYRTFWIQILFPQWHPIKFIRGNEPWMSYAVKWTGTSSGIAAREMVHTYLQPYRAVSNPL